MRLLLFALCLLVGCAAPDAEPALLITGGPIITLDPDLRPDVEAVVVVGDRVEAVGSARLLAEDFPHAERYDLAGRTLLPGFVDAHTHVFEFGYDQRKADLTGATTVAAMVERLQTRYPDPAPGQWLIGAGWDEGVWASQGYPDRAALDAAFPDHPVALESLHGFAGFYNAQALATAGVTAETPDPEGGTILRRPDGTPTGVLLTLAQRLVDQHIPPPSDAEIQEAILAGLTTMAAAGVTSVHEAGMPPARAAAFQALADAGRLPVRVYGLLDGNDAPLVDAWLARGPQIDPAAWFTVRGFKVFYDGSLGSRTALLHAPYHDAPDAARPTERISPERVGWLAEQAAERGFQLAVHAIGDAANTRVLDRFEAALATHPNLDHRWRIEHAQVVRPAFYERAAQLGVIASMQPSHAVGDSKWAEDRLGPDRIQHAYAWRTLLDAGVPLVFNSDLPGEPWTPLETLYFAVTRQTLDGTPPAGWYPEQALTVEEALHAITYMGAFSAFQEDQLGSITVGKLADFVELGQDPRTVAPEQLAQVPVVQTWVGGAPR